MKALLVGMTILALAACGDSAEPVATTPPATQPPATATTAPPPTTVAPTTTAPPATTTTVAPTTTAPPATTTTVASTSTADGFADIVVAPNAPLVGVPLGTEAEAALVDLKAQFGPPTEDTGWWEGCPLDAAGANERFVDWGGLSAQFRLDEAGVGRFVVWTYNQAFGEPPAPISLPGGVSFGDPMADAAAALGTETQFDETFGVIRVGVDGLEIWSDPAGAGDEISLVGVPFVPTCE